jgi:hypothetical protein
MSFSKGLKGSAVRFSQNHQHFPCSYILLQYMHFVTLPLSQSAVHSGSTRPPQHVPNCHNIAVNISNYFQTPKFLWIVEVLENLKSILFIYVHWTSFFFYCFSPGFFHLILHIDIFIPQWQCPHIPPFFLAIKGCLFYIRNLSPFSHFHRPLQFIILVTLYSLVSLLIMYCLVMIQGQCYSILCNYTVVTGENIGTGLQES